MEEDVPGDGVSGALWANVDDPETNRRRQPTAILTLLTACARRGARESCRRMARNVAEEASLVKDPRDGSDAIVQSPAQRRVEHKRFHHQPILSHSDSAVVRWEVGFFGTDGICLVLTAEDGFGGSPTLEGRRVDFRSIRAHLGVLRSGWRRPRSCASSLRASRAAPISVGSTPTCGSLWIRQLTNETGCCSARAYGKRLFRSAVMTSRASFGAGLSRRTW